MNLFVAPANAGAHTPRQMLSEKEDHDQRKKQFPLVVMGPCFRRDDVRTYAVTASTRSSSSISSSIGAKVESGLVESVIGLRLP